MMQNLVTKIEFYIKKYHFSKKSRFKDSKCAGGGHYLNRDFTVLAMYYLYVSLHCTNESYSCMAKVSKHTL